MRTEIKEILEDTTASPLLQKWLKEALEAETTDALHAAEVVAATMRLRMEAK